MELSKLSTIKSHRSAKRVGRGHSSGKGKTSGRGQKGQKARNKLPLGFEGGQTPLYKRVPFIRGKGHRKISIKPFPINVESLEVLSAGTTVTLETLLEAKLITPKAAREHGAKILGSGTLTKKLTVEVPATKAAQEKIEQAGGTVRNTKGSSDGDQA